MRRTIAGAALLLMGAMSANGCTAASETYHGIRGADYEIKEIQFLAASKADRPLSEYSRFELVPFVDDMGGRVPRDFFDYLPGEFSTALAKRGLGGLSGGKTLLVRGKVTNYETQGLGEMLVTPMEEAIARVELVDQKTGKVLGLANCIGRSQARTTMGNRKMAQGVGRAIAAWIASRHPGGAAEETD